MGAAQMAAVARLDRGPAADTIDMPILPPFRRLLGLTGTRLAPAKAHQQHHDCAHGVQMAYGVQGEPSQSLGRGVSKDVRQGGMAEFVNR